MEWLLGALGVVGGAAGSYLIARRKMSGSVAVTDADRLWQEAEKARRLQDTRIYELEIDILRLRRENHELRNELTKVQLLNTPNIPNEVRDRILEQQGRHLRDIEDALERKRAHRSEAVPVD